MFFEDSGKTEDCWAMFPFNWFPQRVGTQLFMMRLLQLMMFPFNWFPQRVGTICRMYRYRGHGKRCVSIQLVSPASGDSRRGSLFGAYSWSRFHSIGFPSEWGPYRKPGYRRCICNLSIQLVSPASGDKPYPQKPLPKLNFPFNWFPQRVGTSLVL